MASAFAADASANRPILNKMPSSRSRARTWSTDGGWRRWIRQGPVDQVTRRGRVVHPAENGRGPLVERCGVKAFGVVDRVQALADQLVSLLDVVQDQRVDRGGVDL